MPPDSDGAGLRARLIRARADLEDRLRRGENAGAEIYLDADPALAADSDAAIELIYAEYVARGELGDPTDHEVLCARFPAWEDELRDLLRIHDLMKESLDDRFPDRGDPQEPPESDPFRAIGGGPSPRLGHFEIIEAVGRGGMALVYKARDLNLGRLVALKMIRPEARADADPGRFRAEAEAVARLQHPNIVQIHEIFDDAGRSFISFEFIEGGSLEQALRDGPRPPREAAGLLEVVARAIAYAHGRGVVHLDLKPANVLLTTDGVPKVVDFGLARQVVRDRPAAEAEATGESPQPLASIAGTFGYMAPEQFGGRLVRDGLPADVYSLGAILYELLTGRRPFVEATHLEDLARGASPAPEAPSELRPGLPRDLDAICMKCLHADPAGRYLDAGLLADDLRRYLAGEPVHARAVGTGEWVWKWARRRPATAALAATCALALLGLLVGSIWYNAKLHVLALRTERHRAEAERRSILLHDQLEFSRRSLYALQLTHVENSTESNPGLARMLLEDAQYCPPELRDFTWGYFLRISKRKRGDYRKHALGAVSGIAFSPDGRVMAVSGGPADREGAPGHVKLLDPMSEVGEYGTLVEPLGPIRSLAFSHDGRTLATGGVRSAGPGVKAGTLRLWNMADESEPCLIDGGPAAVLRVVFSPDGKTLASAGGDGVVTLRDPRSGAPRGELNGHEGAVRGLAFAPDGRTLATGGADGTVRCWDVATCRQRRLLKGHSAPVNAVAFAPDGLTLASAGADKVAALWGPAELRPRVLLRGHLASVLTLAFSLDGATLITGGEDCIVRLWRTEDGHEEAALNIHDGPVSALAFAPADDIFATGSVDQTAKVWDLVAGRQRPPLRGHTAKVTAALFTPDGDTLITAGRDDAIRLWDTAKCRVREALPAGASEGCIALEPGGQVLASGGADGHIRLRNVGGAHESIDLPGHEGKVTALAFSPDGGTLASGGADGTARLWDVATRSCRATLKAHSGVVRALTFSPDGKVLASGGDDWIVRFWDPTSALPLAELKGHTQGVFSLAFHPDGKTLASGGKDRTIHFWDRASGKTRAVLWGHNHGVRSIVFSPDGRTMASTTGNSGPNAVGEVKLWDAVTGHVRATFQGKTAPIAFSPDGRTLLTGNHDETFNLLEAAPEFVGQSPSPGAGGARVTIVP